MNRYKKRKVKGKNKQVNLGRYFAKQKRLLDTMNGESKSHVINFLLISFVWFVLESILALGFSRTDLSPLSLGLYENLWQIFGTGEQLQ